MLSDSLIISILFRLINFAILVGLSVWAFYKYVYSVATDQIAERESFVNGLLQQNTVLKGKQRKIEEQIAQQAVLYKDLSERVLFWQDEYTKEQRKLAQEHERNRAENWQRLQKRAELQALNEQFTRVVAKALDEAEQELIVLRDGVQATHFLDRIIARLEQKEEDK